MVKAPSVSASSPLCWDSLMPSKEQGCGNATWEVTFPVPFGRFPLISLSAPAHHWWSLTAISSVRGAHRPTPSTTSSANSLLIGGAGLRLVHASSLAEPDYGSPQVALSLPRHLHGTNFPEGAPDCSKSGNIISSQVSRADAVTLVLGLPHTSPPGKTMSKGPQQRLGQRLKGGPHRLL